MSERARVLIADDVEHEDLIAEIQVDGDCVATISQEDAELRIEFDHSWVWSKGRKELSLAEFKEALEQAEAGLRRMKKVNP